MNANDPSQSGFGLIKVKRDTMSKRELNSADGSRWSEEDGGGSFLLFYCKMQWNVKVTILNVQVTYAEHSPTVVHPAPPLSSRTHPPKMGTLSLLTQQTPGLHSPHGPRPPPAYFCLSGPLGASDKGNYTVFVLL